MVAASTNAINPPRVLPAHWPTKPGRQPCNLIAPTAAEQIRRAETGRVPDPARDAEPVTVGTLRRAMARQDRHVAELAEAIFARLDRIERRHSAPTARAG